VVALERAEQLKPGGDRTAWLFRALAHHRLGETDQAARWAAKVAAVGPAAYADVEWARLRVEAADWLDSYLVCGGRIAGATVKDGEMHP
jgi:hypothetical protein